MQAGAGHGAGTQDGADEEGRPAFARSVAPRPGMAVGTRADEPSRENHWSLQAGIGHLPLGPFFPSQWDFPVKTVNRLLHFRHFTDERLLNLAFLHRSKVLFP